MLTWEGWAFFSLHETACWIAIVVIGSANSDIASGLLHNDAQDDTLFDTNLGGFEDSVVNAAHILATVACLEHLWLVDVEERDEIFPCLLSGK
jgi:hypothetical protein